MSRSLFLKFFLVSFFSLVAINVVYAEESIDIHRAQVIGIIKEERNFIMEEMGKQLEVFDQTLSAKIIDGGETGKQIILENDYLKLKKGDIFFVEKISIEGEKDNYVVRERDRQFPTLMLLLFFAFAILIFGGKQGFRSLLSLVSGFLVIIYFLLPLLAKGYSPILISVTFASIILFFAIYFTHGFNRESTAAFLGTIIAVIFTGLLAFFSVFVMQLTGFNTEETTFLNVGNGVRLNFQGLLLGGILIGVLGILDDIAITQAAIVNEISRSANNLTRKEVYKKAMRVGREHVSALVNTLVLAYTGASLPLLLLISNYDYPFGFVISQELFSTEIVRTIVGSIGLVLTVPITTLLAVYMLMKKNNQDIPPEVSPKEKTQFEHFGHRH